MPTPSPRALPARVAIAALALLGLIGGCYFLLAGGFHHGTRFSRETTFVSGPAACLMAAIFFVMGATAVAALLQAGRAWSLWYWLFYGLVMPIA